METIVFKKRVLKSKSCYGPVFPTEDRYTNDGTWVKVTAFLATVSCVKVQYNEGTLGMI